MNFKQYEEAAMRTMSKQTAMDFNSRMNTAALGLAGESGEFAELWKKYMYHNHPFDEGRLAKEVGDILWYCALAARALGTSLERIAEDNIEKLRFRYPDAFDPDRSMNKTDG
jgi:NTP pyrophosphatase (non-canonical NTP hydrolase)